MAKPLRYESSRERQYRKLKIFIPNADNSTHTISIEYAVSDALRFFDEHDEFYWNVTGDEWDVPIESAALTSFFPVTSPGCAPTLTPARITPEAARLSRKSSAPASTLPPLLLSAFTRVLPLPLRVIKEYSRNLRSSL